MAVAGGFILAATAESAASAQAVSDAPVAAVAPRHRPRRAAEASDRSASEGPQAEVQLNIDAPTPRGPWTMRIVNDGTLPVRVVADARWLTLDVTPRGARRAERCELPAEMRTEDVAGRNLVLPPKQAYVEIFEPRLYCFSGKALSALSPTSIVVAHLGWMGKGATDWELTPIDGVEPAVAPRKHLDAPPVALPDEQFPPGPVAPSSGERAPLTLEAPEILDVESPDEIAFPVTLHNRGPLPSFVRFRPDTMGFEVLGPSGKGLCAWPTLPAAPTRELFVRLLPGASTQMTFAMAAFCGGDSLDREGLLVVRPFLDTRSAGGQSIGLTGFAGQVRATAPTFVRLRRGRQPPVRTPPQLAPP
jgi:hypothetical protein